VEDLELILLRACVSNPTVRAARQAVRLEEASGVVGGHTWPESTWKWARTGFRAVRAPPGFRRGDQRLHNDNCSNPVHSVLTAAPSHVALRSRTQPLHVSGLTPPFRAWSRDVRTSPPTDESRSRRPWDAVVIPAARSFPSRLPLAPAPHFDIHTYTIGSRLFDARDSTGRSRLS
jgi:hypothetical protein